MKCSKAAVVIYINVMLYSICFRLQSPVEPFLVSKLGGAAQYQRQYGWLQSLQSVMHGVGSVAMGLLMDIWGVRQSFMICYGATALSYGLLAASFSMFMLFLSKLPTFLQHGYLLSQAWLAQHTSEEDRPMHLMLVGLFYTLGSSASPVIGGWIAAQGDYYMGAEAAAAVSVLSVLLCGVLPATLPEEGEDAVGGQGTSSPTVMGKATGSSFMPDAAGSRALAGAPLPSPVMTPIPFRRLGVDKLRSILSRSVIYKLIAVKFGCEAQQTLVNFTLPLALKDQANAGTQQLGEAMGLSQFLGTLLGWSLVTPLSRKLTPQVLMKRCMILLGIMQSMGVVFMLEVLDLSPEHKGYTWLVCTTLHSANEFVRQTVLVVMLTSAVVPSERGTLVGLEHAIQYVPQAFTPQIAVSILKLGGMPAVYSMAVAINVAVMLFLEYSVLPTYRKKGA